ncbi:MAG TPA: SDR family oxidoreductase [Chromatiaceae bacterium]|jgi:NAD(P)-dependent dehydrogenase (short-subunit alcohol dehydrogenase family)|nr:MAG: hypothetical protein N838_19250 [Thiohalocapsa sp. PB-PSB1]QQO52609.1 MAG: SDR family NAD(P)-dependent oxidoreductase [Thiohalocapsa sp. PB-PSB1]HBG95191.1 SDR family oxidoreductase [Chromatiaceae bacterium]HCS91776.1 SDR family oxidoreductase [Chromatiaceae bacterium]
MTDRGEKRIALVTGATGVIGKAIAERIATTPGFEVVLLCRDATKAEAAVTEIRERTGNAGVSHEIVDLSRRASIAELAMRWQGPVHVLVNNAAITARQRSETPEGIELQFATNVLGYFRMIQAFRDRLAAAAPSRVVNVASYWAGGLHLRDLEFRLRHYDNDSAYRQSKQADRMLTVAFAERLRGDGIDVNACHPGDLSSTLSRNLGFGGHETPEQAADTPAWLATDPGLTGETGRYYERRRVTTCRFGSDADAVDALFQACEGYD